MTKPHKTIAGQFIGLIVGTVLLSQVIILAVFVDRLRAAWS